MKFIVDSNVLFTFFWKDSILRHVLEKPVALFSLEYALSEINMHASEIIKKSKTSEDIFNKQKVELALHVHFISLKEYASCITKAVSLAKQYSKKDYNSFIKDIDFYALALKTGCPIWTNDDLFKKQKEILVFDTKEIITLCNSL